MWLHTLDTALEFNLFWSKTSKITLWKFPCCACKIDQWIGVLHNQRQQSHYVLQVINKSWVFSKGICLFYAGLYPICLFCSLAGTAHLTALGLGRTSHSKSKDWSSSKVTSHWYSSLFWFCRVKSEIIRCCLHTTGAVKAGTSWWCVAKNSLEAGQCFFFIMVSGAAALSNQDAVT